MNIDLTTIINAIIALLAALVTYRVIPWIKAQTTNEQQAYIRALVKAGVFAAEQIYNADGMGREKMDYVKKFLQGHGYDINVTEIEAAVSEYINHAAIPVVSVQAVDTVDAMINPGVPIDSAEG